MYICNSFFDYKRLDDRINEWKDSTDYTLKYGLASYTNKGKLYHLGRGKTCLPLNAIAYIILHEMMHANRVAYAANGDRHIVDMNMKIWQYKQSNPNDSNDDQYTKRKVSVDAYGAMNTKILARTSRFKIASDITLNGQF